jgi:hypothetical protein
VKETEHNRQQERGCPVRTIVTAGKDAPAPYFKRHFYSTKMADKRNKDGSFLKQNQWNC